MFSKISGQKFIKQNWIIMKQNKNYLKLMQFVIFIRKYCRVKALILLVKVIPLPALPWLHQQKNKKTKAEKMITF